ncbi:MAG: sigma-54-dependent transcriptional regulator [Gemmataceae bacterium]
MDTKPRYPIHLLIVDDDEQLSETLRSRFERQDMKVCLARNGEEALTSVEQCRRDVVLLDLNLPDWNGIDLLPRLKEKQPDLEILLLTAHSSIQTAIEAMKRGAYDYLSKPFPLSELEIHVQKAYEKVRLARRERQWVDHLHYESPRYSLIGSSQALQKVVRMIEKVAPTEATVLIRGASGTGKELVARALHNNSQRRDRPLVTINCATFQETLLESELFGHEKGAFTGATNKKSGLIEVAEGGTLFIDEVAEMAPSLQAKLLRVLEDCSYRRVGGTHELHADVRIVAATNKDLLAEQQKGKFREDLYYRLNVVTIQLPTLKERPEDIPELVAHFLETRRIGTRPFIIDDDAIGALQSFDWPGNVRELANVLERAQIVAEENRITLDDLPENIYDSKAVSSCRAISLNGLHNAQELREVERCHVETVLRQEKGNKLRAAKVLGVSRRALYRLINKHGLGDEFKSSTNASA